MSCKIIKYIGWYFLMVLSISVYGQSGKSKICGYVRDFNTGESLIGASIYNLGSARGVITDVNGFFSLATNQGDSIQIAYIGYQSLKENCNVNTDSVIIFRLLPGESLEEVTIVADNHYLLNTNSLSSEKLLSIPSLGAKPDVFKGLQLFPGIKSQNEGSSLLLVRGGEPGQNFYLIDGIPLIYVNHLGGFMSVFDPEIINKLDVYKGGFPSRYGGKLSSVIDITQREGNSTQLKGSLGIGISDVSFSFEGPLSEKISFIITGRKTLTEPFMLLGSILSDQGFYTGYGFHDINSKFSFRPNSKNAFYFNIYQGDDYLYFGPKSNSNDQGNRNNYKNIWGNILLSARWNNIVNSKIYTTTSLAFNKYRLIDQWKTSFSTLDRVVENNRKYQSSVQTIYLNSQLKYYLNSYVTIESGIQNSLSYYLPNEISDSENTKLIGSMGAGEINYYAEIQSEVGTHFNFKTGIRWANYFQEKYNFSSIEPRLTCDYRIFKQLHLIAEYSRMNQFSHLIFNSGNFLSNELWIPATQKFKPSKSDQITFGIKTGVFDKKWTVEVNGYYKTLENMTIEKEGYDKIFGDVNWHSKLVTGGSGVSKGVEVMVNKNYGNWNGFASYSWSKTIRKYNEINKGKWYPYEFDRPHSISFLLSCQISSKWKFSSAWTYLSGLPFTPAKGRYLISNPYSDDTTIPNQLEVLDFGPKNSARMNNYHRLDLGFTYQTYSKKQREVQWNFSVYNAYFHKNPYYYYYSGGGINETYNIQSINNIQPIKLYQISSFPIIPTVSYKLFFDRSKPVSRNQHTFKEKFSNWLFYEN